MAGNIDSYGSGSYGESTAVAFFHLESRDSLRSGTLQTKAPLKPLCLSRASSPPSGLFCDSFLKKSRETESHSGLRMGYGVMVGVGVGRTGRALPTVGADGTGMLPLWLSDWDLTTADSSEAVSDP